MKQATVEFCVIALLMSLAGCAGEPVAEFVEIHHPRDVVSNFTPATLPHTPPWPDCIPAAAAPNEPPRDSDDLTRFRGYDAIVVTWTSAEADALAALLSPGFAPTTWYPYRHDVETYVPLVTGGVAPFNDGAASMKRYYHTLGLYMPVTIGHSKVLLFKSGLHLDYDGPACPVKRLMTQIVEEVQPALFITTGTGGGIGADVCLGDVIVAGKVKFDCTTKFKAQDWATAEYKCASAPAHAFESLDALLKFNADKVVGGRSVPNIWHGPNITIVTTDFFGFDDSTNHFGLQGLGQCCEMGDAMVAQALSAFPNVKFYAIRNASDPQIPNPNGDIHAAEAEAGHIYTRYGAYTTAASVIATWAVIRAECGK